MARREPHSLMESLIRIALLVFFVSSLGIQVAYAQRGQMGASYSAPMATPTQGFQGFFDAEQTDAGTVTGDLFSFSLDYGVTERLSVGTNPVLVIGYPFGLNSLLLKSRYRYYSSGRLVSALTIYGGGAFVSGSSDFGYLGMFTSNTTYFLDQKQSIGLSLAGGRLGLSAGDLGDLDYIRAGVSAAFVAGQYRIAFAKNVLVEVLLGSFVAQSIEADTASESLTIDVGLGAVSAGSFLGRLMADVRVFDVILLSPQIYALGSVGNDPSFTMIPLINIAFRID